MNEERNNEAVFRHLRVAGTPREVGRKEAEHLLRCGPEAAALWPAADGPMRAGTREAVTEALRAFERHCPWVNEEIRGFADALGRKPEDVVHYSFSHVARGSCSHFAVLPAKTADGHMAAGRSYEYSEEDDKRLTSLRMEGCHAHLGFSLLLFGRYDGINDKGLSVTMSMGLPMVESSAGGFRFWMIVRILLDTCADVEEALERLQGLPLSGYPNLVLADRGGHAALVELHDDVRAVRRIGPGDPDGLLGSTNHYRLPGMETRVRNRMRQSVERYEAIERALRPERIDRAALRGLLSAHTPDGLACHYYKEWLGTLWSCLYDLTAGAAEICFGSPLANPWRTFVPAVPENAAGWEGEDEYRALFPQRDAPPTAWERV